MGAARIRSVPSVGVACVSSARLGAGTRRHPDLGMVEFIASDSRNIILIATSKRIFAISPMDAGLLVRTFARATEMGSLTPAEPKSVYPSFIITRPGKVPSPASCG